MRRIARAFLCIIQAALLLITAAALLLWTRSHWVGDVIIREQDWNEVGEVRGNELRVISTEGLIWVNWRWDAGRTGPSWAGWQEKLKRTGVRPRWRWASMPPDQFEGIPDGMDRWGPLGWDKEDSVDQLSEFHIRTLYFPHWLFALACGIWPLTALALLFRRLRRRARTGCCFKCGYDLRATPQAGAELVPRCPECGTATRPSSHG